MLFRSYGETFKSLFVSTGTARSASALAAAMIASAMRKDADAESVISDALAAAAEYRRSREGRYWRSSSLYPVVALKAEQLLETAAELGFRYRDPYAYRSELAAVAVQPFFADGCESLAVAASMFAASGGKYEESVSGCVCFGRDNDSSAAVAGAVAGALNGASAIPADWIETVESANAVSENDRLRNLCSGLTSAVAGRMRLDYESVRRQGFYFGEWQIDSKEGEDALRKAAAEGCTEKMEALLLAGINPDAVDEKGTTALHFAAWENRPEAVSLLLEHSADPEIAEGDGWTALHDALRREYYGIAEMIFSALCGRRQVCAGSEKDLSGNETPGDLRFLDFLKRMDSEFIRLDAVGICGKGLADDARERGYSESLSFLKEASVND